jgi:hypothetical protein
MPGVPGWKLLRRQREVGAAGGGALDPVEPNSAKLAERLLRFRSPVTTQRILAMQGQATVATLQLRRCDLEE